MPSVNPMISTGVPNVRQRTLANGDIAYYVRVHKSFSLIGVDSQGMTPMKAAEMMQQDRAERWEARKGRTCYTLNDVFNRFKVLLDRNPHATKHDLSYVQRYNDYVMDKFGRRRLDCITSTEIKQLYTFVYEEHSESLAYHVCNTIRYLYNRAIEWRMYAGPKPMGKGTDFVLPRPQRRREEVFSADEVVELVTKLDRVSKDLGDMVRIAYVTGMRMGEIFGLKVSHVNMRTGRIKIVDPKGGKDTYAQLTPDLLEMVKLRASANPEQLIFPDRYGKKRKGLSKTFNKVLDEMGINDGVEDSRFKRTFHSLRHTFATDMLASGEVNIGDLQQLMGHKSITTTQRYIHPAEEAMSAAAMVMGNRLRKTV